MKNYKICIPSYKRSTICNNKTLKTLHELGISKNNIFVFVVAEELDQYKIDLNPDWYEELIVGEKGLVAQRQFITDYFPAWTYIISLDDDIEGLDLSLTDFTSADDFFNYAFAKCEEQDAFLWSVYPVFNPWFRKERKHMTTNLSFCIGAFYGYINRPFDETLMTPLSPSGNKEDVERSIRYYLKDGKVVRFNRVGFKTKYYGTDGGGLGTFKDRLELMKQNAIKLNEAFPDLTRIKIRKNGMYEIVLKSKVERKRKMEIKEEIKIDPDIEWLPEVTEEELATLYFMLTNTTIPKLSNKMGRAVTFGVHRSMTLGYVKGRISRKLNLSLYSKKYPYLYDEVVRLGKKICPFEFSAVHINYNVCCPRHIDGNNTGKSMIISLGEYTGGRLFIEGKGEFNTQNHPLIFDGAKHYHWNAPITSGDKYSLVFFSHQKIE
jgi:hypothetical protein